MITACIWYERVRVFEMVWGGEGRPRAQRNFNIALLAPGAYDRAMRFPYCPCGHCRQEREEEFKRGRLPPIIAKEPLLVLDVPASREQEVLAADSEAPAKTGAAT